MVLCAGFRDKETLLRSVDLALENADAAQNIALQTADSLANEALKTSQPSRRLSLLMESSALYQALDMQKALEYLSMAREMVRDGTHERGDSIRVLMKMAALYNSEGMMVKEASDIYRHLDPDKIPEEQMLQYFILGVQINKSLSDRAFDPRLKLLYDKKASEYRDSVLKLDPHSLIIAANKLLENDQIREALQLIKDNPPSPGTSGRTGPYYHYMAGLYRQLGENDSVIKCLAIAAEDDLRHGVREYMALPELAELLEPSDLDRAQRYILQSRMDAEESHSSIRKIEVTPIFDLIQRTVSEREKRKYEVIGIISISLFVIMIGVISAILVLRKKNLQLIRQKDELKKSRDLVDEANIHLEGVNLQLAEESRVKESYIRAFMQLCLSYLGKMESYRARIGRIAATGDVDKVLKAINSSRYVNQEISEFYTSFDRAFFSLYPDFISILNSLLKEDEKFPEDDKFSTELRVYALIWLGIDSSGEIAKFLRCSESTVYNYRTIMRNRAIDRTNFEHEFIEISRLKRHQ